MQEKANHRRFIRINGVRVTKRFSRQSDADRWYLEQKRKKEQIESGIGQPIELKTLKEYSDGWMACRKAQGKPQSSWKADERRLRLHVLPSMGHRFLQQVTRREWISFLNSLLVEKKLSPATRNRVHALVGKMYNDALKEDIVSANPLSIIDKLQETHDKWDYWHSAEECHKYLEAAKNERPPFFVFAMLALNTGARIGELLAIQLEDIQLSGKRIHIWRTYEQETGEICERTKGKCDRWLGMTEPLYEVLNEFRSQMRQKKPGRLLICHPDGNPFNEWTMRRAHYRVCKKAGIKPVRLHDLRHTYASHYVMNGGSIGDLRALLGHATSEMTQKYAHLAPGHLESKSKVIAFSAGSGSGKWHQAV